MNKVAELRRLDISVQKLWMLARRVSPLQNDRSSGRAIDVLDFVLNYLFAPTLYSV